MNTPLTTDDHIDYLAQRRAKAKMGWFTHAAIYVIVNAFLMAMSLAGGKHWAVFPLQGWGIGLAMHGVAVWFAAPGSQFREKLIERERQTLRQQRDAW